MDKKFNISATLNVILLLALIGVSFGWHYSSTKKCPPCIEVGTKTVEHDTIVKANSTPTSIPASNVIVVKKVVKPTVRKDDNVDLISLIPEVIPYEFNIVSRRFSRPSFQVDLTDTVHDNNITGSSFIFTDNHRDTFPIKVVTTTVERPASKVDIFLGANFYSGGDIKTQKFTGDIAPNLSCLIKGKYQVNFTYLPFHKEAGIGFSYKLFAIR